MPFSFLTSLFQVSTTEKADVLFNYSIKTSVLCILQHQSAESVHVICDVLRNPSFTFAMLIPIVRGITSQARWCMAPKTRSIRERIRALVRVPRFSREVN